MNISTRNLDIVEWSRQQVDQIMGNSAGADDISVESLGDYFDDILEDIYRRLQPGIISRTSTSTYYLVLLFLKERKYVH